MQVTGLDFRTYKLDLARKVVVADTRVRSSGHLEARRLLVELYPFDPPHEEVSLPGCQRPLYLDFLLPTRKLAVEVQGVQHRQFTPHFHGSQAKFREQVHRDRLKVQFCELNGIVLVHLHDDRREGWAGQLRNAWLAGSPAPEAGPVGT